MEGLALCENITTRAEFTVCYEASFLPIRQYAANNELQTRLLHIFEDRWAKPIGQCAAGPMDEQYKCTVDVVLALQSEYVLAGFHLPSLVFAEVYCPMPQSDMQVVEL